MIPGPALTKAGPFFSLSQDEVVYGSATRRSPLHRFPGRQGRARPPVRRAAHGRLSRLCAMIAVLSFNRSATVGATGSTPAPAPKSNSPTSSADTCKARRRVRCRGQVIALNEVTRRHNLSGEDPKRLPLESFLDNSIHTMIESQTPSTSEACSRHSTSLRCRATAASAGRKLQLI